MQLLELDRSAIIVIPKQPLLDWLHSIDPDGPRSTLSEMAEDPTVYLVRACESDRAFNDRLRKIFPAIFENELAAWFTDESLWPTDRTLKTFREWFDIRFHSMVFEASD